MQPWFEDWRFLILIYIICSGIWGVLAKVASNRLDPLSVSFIALTSAWLFVAVMVLRKLSFQSGVGIIAAAAGGFLGGISTLALYGALRQAPANTVIPMSSLYLILTVILSCIFLRETMDVRKILGIFLGLSAILLLAR